MILTTVFSFGKMDSIMRRLNRVVEVFYKSSKVIFNHMNYQLLAATICLCNKLQRQDKNITQAKNESVARFDKNDKTEL